LALDSILTPDVPPLPERCFVHLWPADKPGVGCVILNHHFVVASAHAAAPAVNVQAKNGSFPVK
jgi:hypothetical protein